LAIALPGDRLSALSGRARVTRIPFRLRGVDGTVSVEYGVNQDPERWGYAVLNLDWYRREAVHGFPFMQASVDHPSEGYAANMAWIQVVRYVVRDPGDEHDAIVFDVPPQFSDSDVPYFAFGVRPTVFDAPSIVANDVTWRAATFLVYTPDAVLSRVLRSVCGFTWGYDVRAGVREVKPLRVADYEDWRTILPDLRGRFATWDFQDVVWEGP
jgi:hypothetical protein